MSQQKPAFSTAATARHILVCLLLFLAGDLLSSLAFDLLFAVARPPAPWLYQLPRALGALALTWALFRLYAARGLRLGMAEFGVTFSLRGWAVAASVLMFEAARQRRSGSGVPLNIVPVSGPCRDNI